MSRTIRHSLALALVALAAAVPAAAQHVRELPGRGAAVHEAMQAAKPGPGRVTAPTHFCDHVETIACGQTRSGSITNSDCPLDDGTFFDIWAFDGVAGQQVTLTLTSSQFDTFLFLFDPEVEQRAADDDSAGGGNSRIVFTLDQTGEWLAVPNNFAPGDTGSYSLTLACSTPGGVPAAPSNLSATVLSGTEVELSWRDNSTNETAFVVELREGTSGSFAEVGTVGSNAAGAIVEGLAPSTTYQFRVRARNAAGTSAPSNVVTVTTSAGGGGGFLTTPEIPGFRFRVTILPASGEVIPGTRVNDCIEDTLCVAGALAGRPEVFVRVIGPRPNGFLWPTLVRFTPSAVVVEIEQISSGTTKTYTLPAVPPGVDELSGLQDRTGFLP